MKFPYHQLDPPSKSDKVKLTNIRKLFNVSTQKRDLNVSASAIFVSKMGNF